MDIISDYGSDVWGSNPYGPAIGEDWLKPSSLLRFSLKAGA